MDGVARWYAVGGKYEGFEKPSSRDAYEKVVYKHEEKKYNRGIGHHRFIAFVFKGLDQIGLSKDPHE